MVLLYWKFLLPTQYQEQTNASIFQTVLETSIFRLPPFLFWTIIFRQIITTYAYTLSSMEISYFLLDFSWDILWLIRTIFTVIKIALGNSLTLKNMLHQFPCRWSTMYCYPIINIFPSLSIVLTYSGVLCVLT